MFFFFFSLCLGFFLLLLLLFVFFFFERKREMSCLFNSLSRFVDLDAAGLRAEICNFILANAGSLMPGLDAQTLLGMPLLTYVRRMQKPSTWGGAVEIQAFCQRFDAEVEVVNIRDGRQPQPDSKTNGTKDEANPTRRSVWFVSSRSQGASDGGTEPENQVSSQAPVGGAPAPAPVRIRARISWNGNHYEPLPPQ